MPKGFKKYLPFWLIALVVVIAIANIVPFEKGELYKTVYYTILISFVAQLAITFFAFKKEREVAYSVFIYSIVGIIMLIVANYYAIAKMWWRRPWLLALVNIIVLAMHYVFLLLIGTSLEKNIERDESVKDSTNLILSLTEQVNALYKNTKNKDIYRLYETLKHSNKTSNEQTEKVDTEIKHLTEKLLKEKSDENIKNIVDEITKLINKRNSIRT